VPRHLLAVAPEELLAGDPEECGDLAQLDLGERHVGVLAVVFAAVAALRALEA
jgi:hypothetical protein